MIQPIRVLHIVGAIYPGGMENFIMNLYEHIDRNYLQFDIVVHARKENDYAEKIEQMGGRVYVIPRLTVDPIKSLKELYNIVKKNHYPVVIRHTSNALVVLQLLVAKLAGAKTVCHSHNETDPNIFLHRLGRLFMDAAVTERVACSQKAGEWMFGKRKFRIVHNAIDIDRFTYDKEKGIKIKKEFGIDGGKVYGNVANFIPSKNHSYLLQIFKQIASIDPQARFFCVGEGGLRAEIEAEIKKLQLEDKVILTGIRNDVEEIMSCLDVLIFPSIFEGLPLTLIEAQASGLPILMSDTITQNVIVSRQLVYVESISSDPAIWAMEAKRLAYDLKQDRKCQRESIALEGYDIRQLSSWYQHYLLELAR